MRLIEEDDGDLYRDIALCLSCKNYDGYNQCQEYRGMPLSFFGRKNKCKHYDGIWEAKQ